MIDYLESLDRVIVQTINSWHTPFLDEVMWQISAKLPWIPFYLLLLYLQFKKSNLRFMLLFLVCALLTVVLSDVISTQFFKNVFQRYRPSHHSELTEILHFYRLPSGEFYKGGQYGFISSHAANFFAICTLATYVLRTHYKRILIPLFGVAFLVSFSRMYLGVHYFSDVFVGAIVGIAIGFIIYRYVYLIGADYLNRKD